MRHMLLLVVLVATHPDPGAGAESRGGPGALAQRIVHTDPATYRPSPAVHGGAGTMSFTALLNRGAVTPEFNFLHRGVIPAGAGIGHHFHNVVEEMFVILDGEAQFTIDGRTATVKGPAGVLCRTGHSHAIYNPGPAPVQWMNLNVSMIPGVYDNFDLGDTRVGASARSDPHVHDDAAGRVAAAGCRARAAVAQRHPPPDPKAVLSRRVLGPGGVLDDVVLHRSCPRAARRIDASARARQRGRGVLRAGRRGNAGVKGAASENSAGARRATPSRYGSASRASSPTAVRCRWNCS